MTKTIICYIQCITNKHHCAKFCLYATDFVSVHQIYRNNVYFFTANSKTPRNHMSWVRAMEIIFYFSLFTMAFKDKCAILINVPIIMCNSIFLLYFCSVGNVSIGCVNVYQTLSQGLFGFTRENHNWQWIDMILRKSCLCLSEFPRYISLPWGENVTPHGVSAYQPDCSTPVLYQ